MSICSCMWSFCWNTCLKEVTSYLVLIWLRNYDRFSLYIYICIYYRYIVPTCTIICTSTAQCLRYTCAVGVVFFQLYIFFLFFTTMQTLPGCFGFAVESTPCVFSLYPHVATRSEISIIESFPCWLMHWFMFHHAQNSQNTRAVLWIRVRVLIWFRLSFALPIVCSCHG